MLFRSKVLGLGFCFLLMGSPTVHAGNTFSFCKEVDSAAPLDNEVGRSVITSTSAVMQVLRVSHPEFFKKEKFDPIRAVTIFPGQEYSEQAPVLKETVFKVSEQAPVSPTQPETILGFMRSLK